MEQPTPADDKTQYVTTISTIPFGEEEYALNDEYFEVEK